jgi:hypothetical protein
MKAWFACLLDWLLACLLACLLWLHFCILPRFWVTIWLTNMWVSLRCHGFLIYVLEWLLCFDLCLCNACICFCFHSGIMVLTQFLHAECKLISSWDNYYLSLTVVVLFMTKAQQAVVQEDVWKRKRHWWAVRRLL